MSAPAAFVMSKLLLPETQVPPAEGLSALKLEQPARNLLDAASLGATDGLKLAANVAAMLVAFVSLLALVNWPIRVLGEWAGSSSDAPWSLEAGLGWVGRPVAWLFGVEWEDAGRVGSLVGVQVIATEFVAYSKLQGMILAHEIRPRSAQIATYALCGFANIPSIAIQIGGLSAIAPSRRADFVSLAPRAMVAGLMACWMTAAIASVFLS
jgi:CNT family concentrative nucleoside transporter